MAAGGRPRRGWTLLRSQDPSRAPLYQYTHDLQVLDRSHAARRRRPDAFVVPGLEAGRYIPGLDMPVWRVPEGRDWGPVHADLLFGPDDPAQAHDLAAERPDRVRALEEILAAHAWEIGAPEEIRRRLRIA